MNTQKSNSFYLTTLAFLAGLVLIAAMTFGFVGSAGASEGATGSTGATGVTGETSKPTLTKQWWKKNNKAIKLITKQCRYRPAYRLLIKIRKPGLTVRSYLHMGWLAIASYGVSKTYGANWKKPNKKRKAQRRKLRRKMAKTARKWANKGLVARDESQANEEIPPGNFNVDYRAFTALDQIPAGQDPLVPCKRR